LTQGFFPLITSISSRFLYFVGKSVELKDATLPPLKSFNSNKLPQINLPACFLV